MGLRFLFTTNASLKTHWRVNLGATQDTPDRCFRDPADSLGSEAWVTQLRRALQARPSAGLFSGPGLPRLPSPLPWKHPASFLRACALSSIPYCAHLLRSVRGAGVFLHHCSPVSRTFDKHWLNERTPTSSTGRFWRRK